jgi:hypothetical protein
VPPRLGQHLLGCVALAASFEHGAEQLAGVGQIGAVLRVAGVVGQERLVGPANRLEPVRRLRRRRPPPAGDSRRWSWAAGSFPGPTGRAAASPRGRSCSSPRRAASRSRDRHRRSGAARSWSARALRGPRMPWVNDVNQGVDRAAAAGQRLVIAASRRNPSSRRPSRSP